MVSYGVAISVFSFKGLEEGKGWLCPKCSTRYDFCQAQKAQNTDPSTNYAVKYATARGHPVRSGSEGLSSEHYETFLGHWRERSTSGSHFLVNKGQHD